MFSRGEPLPMWAAPAPGAPWVVATDVTGPNGEVLYTNTGDAANAAPAFADGTNWIAFTGTLS